MKTKKLLKVLSISAVALMLTACSDDIVNLPADKGDQVFNITNDNNHDVTNNNKEDIYNAVAKSTTPSAATLDNILLQLAESRTSQSTNASFPLTSDELESDIKERWQKEMVNAARGSTYSTDNVFDEYRYAQSLTASMYTIKTKAEVTVNGTTYPAGSTDPVALKAAANSLVVTPDMTYDEIFKLDYTDYVTRHYRPDILRRYLTAWYIYKENYSSIGATSARDVTTFTLVDSTDKPGLALRYIQAFQKTYVNSHNKEQADLHHLERLWKGIGDPSNGQAKDENGITPLSSEDIQWYKDNGLVNAEGNPDTKIQQVYDDVAKIKENEYETDSALESKYTNSDAYSVEYGETLAIRSIAAETYVSEGLYLKSNGLSSLPSTLKDRTFESNYNTDVNAVASGERKDNSYIVPSEKDADGNVSAYTDGTLLRYVTPSVQESSDQIYTYDSGTKTYYIVQFATEDQFTDEKDLTRDTSRIVTSSRLSQNSSDSEEVKKFKRELAMDTAYEMADSDTYKKAAVTYFFTHNHISYSDPDFYDYMKTNYPDCFNTDGKAVYNGEE